MGESFNTEKKQQQASDPMKNLGAYSKSFTEGTAGFMVVQRLVLITEET